MSCRQDFWDNYESGAKQRVQVYGNIGPEGTPSIAALLAEGRAAAIEPGLAAFRATPLLLPHVLIFRRLQIPMTPTSYTARVL